MQRFDNSTNQDTTIPDLLSFIYNNPKKSAEKAAQLAYEFSPLYAITAAQNARENLRQDNDALAAINTLEGILSMIPLAGRVVSKPLGKAAREVVTRPTVSPTKSYSDLPVVNQKDFIGARMGRTSADLLDTGRDYTGIDSIGTYQPTSLGGGPRFPLQEGAEKRGLMWADKMETAQKKYSKGDIPDLIAVSAMMPDSHMSNLAFADSYVNTLMQYKNRGLIDEKSIQEIDQAIRDVFLKSNRKDRHKIKALGDFVGFSDPKFLEYMENISFDQRKEIFKKLQQKEIINKFNIPNVDRVRQETLDRSFAGANRGDTLLYLEPDKQNILDLLDLEQSGFKQYSYDAGVLGKPIGRPSSFVSSPNQFPETWESLGTRARYTDQLRALDLKPKVDELMTTEKIENIDLSMRINSAIQDPAQARLAVNMMNNLWKTSTTPKKHGGLDAVEYQDAIVNNPSSPTLTHYSNDYIKNKTKSGEFEAFQLGDDPVFMAVDKKPDYSWINNYQVGPDDKALVGVVSNVGGGSGMAAPATVLKSVEEGVTLLDAFAVKSDRFPNGYLPTVYEEYGFEVVDRIPFSKEFYIAERGEKAYTDLVTLWKSQGMKEGDFPDVVLMKHKFRSDDANRQNATRNFFSEDSKGIGADKDATEIFQASSDTVKSGNASTSQKASGSSRSGNRSGDTRNVRNRDGTSPTLRSQSVISEVERLSQKQAENLGLNYNDILSMIGKR